MPAPPSGHSAASDFAPRWIFELRLGSFPSLFTSIRRPQPDRRCTGLLLHYHRGFRPHRNSNISRRRSSSERSEFPARERSRKRARQGRSQSLARSDRIGPSCVGDVDFRRDSLPSAPGRHDVSLDLLFGAHFKVLLSLLIQASTSARSHATHRLDRANPRP